MNKVKTVIIEEYDRVDAAFKTFRYDLKVNNKIGNCLELDLLENLVKEIINNFGKYKDSQQDLIKGKDEYIAKLCNDRTELKEQNKILKEELNAVNGFRTHYKNYLDKINNLTMANERLNYYCEHTEDQISGLHFRNNRLVKRLEKQKAKLIKLREERQLLDNLQMFKKFICEGVLCAIEQNHTYLQLRLTPELKEWCEKEMNKKVVEKYGK